MVALQVVKFAGQAMAFPDIAFFRRDGVAFTGQRGVGFGRRGPHHMDEALKAGIGATVCSVIILGLMLLVLQVFPVGIG